MPSAVDVLLVEQEVKDEEQENEVPFRNLSLRLSLLSEQHHNTIENRPAVELTLTLLKSGVGREWMGRRLHS